MRRRGKERFLGIHGRLFLFSATPYFLQILVRIIVIIRLLSRCCRCHNLLLGILPGHLSVFGLSLGRRTGFFGYRFFQQRIILFPSLFR